jgi:hypothetical protein
MAKEILVNEYIDEAINLIAELDNSGFIIDSALWYYFGEAEEWRLIIATPNVDKDGPLTTYSIINTVVKDKNIFIHTPLRKLTVVSPHDPLIKLLKMAIRTGPSISRIRFQNNFINNTQIEDALIFRLQ